MRKMGWMVAVAALGFSLIAAYELAVVSADVDWGASTTCDAYDRAVFEKVKDVVQNETEKSSSIQGLKVTRSGEKIFVEWLRENLEDDSGSKQLSYFILSEQSGQAAQLVACPEGKQLCWSDRGPSHLPALLLNTLGILHRAPCN